MKADKNEHQEAGQGEVMWGSKGLVKGSIFKSEIYDSLYFFPDDDKEHGYTLKIVEKWERRTRMR